MPKQCPQCRQFYGDQVKFCDLDGTPLPAAAGGATTNRARYRLLALALLTLGAAAVAARYVYHQHLQARLTISFEDLSPAPSEQGGWLRGAVGLAQAATGNGDLVARVRIANATLFAGSVTAAEYTLSAGAREIGKGAWTAGNAPVAFQPGQSVALDLPFRLNPGNTVGSALDALTGKAVPITMRGEMRVASFIEFGIPFEVRLTPGGPQLTQPDMR